MKADGKPPQQEIIEQARYLANAHKHMDEKELIREVARVMRIHYIQGGIGAIDALTDALPAEQLMDAPPDARKVISALLSVCEKFREVMVGKLKS